MNMTGHGGEHDWSQGEKAFSARFSLRRLAAGLRKLKRALQLCYLRDNLLSQNPKRLDFVNVGHVENDVLKAEFSQAITEVKDFLRTLATGT